jgi:tripartite ATP-independent transporter DctM subunit
MDALINAGLLLFFVFLYLGLGVWIFAGVMLVGLSALYFQLGLPIDRIGAIVKGTMWSNADSWEISAVPVFMWMGDLIFRTDISQRLFRGLSPWVAPLPGRLAHTNVIGSALFAAVCGSSVATTATIGKITLRELLSRGYDNDLAVGSLAASGALGIMIPPSIVMIIYGVMTNTSIARLFAAGFLPGLLCVVLYSGYIAAVGMLKPSATPAPERRYNRADRIKGLRDLAPLLFLILVVLGSIYSGVATPNEAGSMGLAATLAVIVATGQFRWKMLVDSLFSTVCLTSMLLTIVITAAFMSAAISYLHLPQQAAAYVAQMNIGPIEFLTVLGAFYIFLGLFLEGVSIFVTTLPLAYPVIVRLGFDPVWFGIFLVIAVELGCLSPPVGVNLYVLQGLTGQSLGRLAIATIPFCLLLLLSCVLITIFPQIALWLPHLLYD